MSIYKDLLFLHGYLRDPSVADDIETVRPQSPSTDVRPAPAHPRPERKPRRRLRDRISFSPTVPLR